MKLDLGHCATEGWLGDVHWALGVIVWSAIAGVAGDRLLKGVGEGRMSSAAAVARAILLLVATPIGVPLSARLVGGPCGYFGGAWLSLGLTLTICGLFLIVRRYERNSNLLRVLAHALVVIAGAHVLWAMSGGPEAEMSRWTSRRIDPILHSVPTVWLVMLGVVASVEIASRSSRPASRSRWVADALEFVAAALGLLAQILIVEFASIPYAGFRLYPVWLVFLAAFVGFQGRLEWQRRRSSV
jgi:hypothetical protein